jgi:hypothetical protein
MYHCLDVEKPQTVPPEKHFVQIDNTSARRSGAHRLRPQKANPLYPKKFRGTSVLGTRLRTPTSPLVPQF